MKGLRPALRLRLAVVLMASLAALVLAELGMRLVFPQRYESRKLHSIVYFHPTRGIGFLPGTNFQSEGQPYQINAQGFRDQDFGPAQPRPEALRIVFLGDSFVEGLGVPVQQSLPKQLEARLRQRFPDQPIEVFNCGVRAGSPAYYRLWLEDLADYRPDLVLINVFDNDVAEDAQAEIDAARLAAAWLRRFPAALRSLHLTHLSARLSVAWNQRVPTPLIDRIGARTGARREEAPLHPHYRFYHQTQRWQPAFENTRQQLTALLERVHALGSRSLLLYVPILCTLPNRPCYQDFFAEHPFQMPLRQQLSDLCAQRAQLWLDSYPILLRRDQQGLRSFLKDGHLNAEGTAALVDELVPLVVQAVGPEKLGVQPPQSP